jgi:hypothetical protein
MGTSISPLRQRGHFPPPPAPRGITDMLTNFFSCQQFSEPWWVLILHTDLAVAALHSLPQATRLYHRRVVLLGQKFLPIHTKFNLIQHKTIYKGEK